MRCAVVMMMPVDAVAPGIGPGVLREQPLAGRGAVAALGQNAAIDHERQGWVVRHDAVIGKAIGFDAELFW